MRVKKIHLSTPRPACMSHCIRAVQQRQAAIAQHTQAADTQRFFNCILCLRNARGMQNHRTFLSN